jgi:molecular chaperone HscB
MNLQATDFELFELRTAFKQDRAAIDARWKELQRQAHPDKFAAQGAAAQRVAMQYSVRINEGYQRLKDPIKRAAYLCELHGAAINAERNTAMPPEFLMEQIEWREALDDASSIEDLEKIQAMSASYGHSSLLKCERLIDADKNYQAAAQQVRVLLFIDKFNHDLDARFEQLGQ